MFKRIFIFFLSPYLLCANTKVELGVDRFFKDGFQSEITGKKIGIITNHTGVTSDLKSTITLFKEKANDFQIVALFAPEHGIDGSAYASEAIKDIKGTGKIPIYSLHGATRRPTKEMLKGIDVLIYDIQDIGNRSYTFATTLYYVMEEAAKHNIKVIVLDRPNPINGTTVDGPMLNSLMRSFIGYINTPYCHGMTIGELASYFNTEYKVQCNLLVVKMKGWKREMSFADTGLTWVPTSPNIPEADSPIYCATTGILGELGLVNIGIGYTLPFKIVGAPWIDADQFAAALNGQNLPGVHFLPFHYKPFFGSFKGKDCHGIKICITDLSVYKPLTVQYFLMGMLKSLYPEKVSYQLASISSSKIDLFNKANGNTMMIKCLTQEKYASWKLIDYQKAERMNFSKSRLNYLLY